MIKGENTLSRKRDKIRYLVLLSLSKGKLDAKKIRFIAKTLTRRELLIYYRMLLRKREEEKAYVTTAIELPADIVGRVAKLFAGKDVVFTKDSHIIAGLSVKVVDFVFDASLKNYLVQVKKRYEIN